MSPRWLCHRRDGNRHGFPVAGLVAVVAPGVVPAALTLCVALASAGAAAADPVVSRVSVSGAGAQANAESWSPVISAQGRLVAFMSYASNLVHGDANHAEDVFVRDLETGQTTLVSAARRGAPANGASYGPAVSADGRYVAFASYASNLVPGDTNRRKDVFVRDLRTGGTRRVSVSTRGAQANGDVIAFPRISADGRAVVFASEASNLVAEDTNGNADVFVRELRTGRTRRVSVSSREEQGNRPSADAATPSISGDGRFVAFQSEASNLVRGDTNRSDDAFLRDIRAGTTTRVSVPAPGGWGNAGSWEPQLSASGRFVAFVSRASNLVPGDGNRANDIFVRDRQRGRTERVSLAAWGMEAGADSREPTISADGRYVAFTSDASDLVTGPVSDVVDLFVRDRRAATTVRISNTADGLPADGWSGEANLSGDGGRIAFESSASDLVPGDTNGTQDVFVWSGG